MIYAKDQADAQQQLAAVQSDAESSVVVVIAQPQPQPQPQETELTQRDVGSITISL